MQIPRRSHSENQAKAESKKYKGVQASLNGWQATIRLNKNLAPSDSHARFGERKSMTYFLGSFATQEGAAIARDQFIRNNKMKRTPNFNPVEFEHRKVQLDWKWPVIKHRKKSSRFHGVSKVGKCWKAGILYKKENIYLGKFDIEDAAAIAVDQYMIEHDIKGKLNFDKPEREELMIKLNWKPKSIRHRYKPIKGPSDGKSGPLSGLVIPRRPRSKRDKFMGRL